VLLNLNLHIPSAGMVEIELRFTRHTDDDLQPEKFQRQPNVCSFRITANTQEWNEKEYLPAFNLLQAMLNVF
jgi:hypothetical protein